MLMVKLGIPNRLPAKLAVQRITAAADGFNIRIVFEVLHALLFAVSTTLLPMPVAVVPANTGGARQPQGTN